jgi:UDP-N-acetyl-D-mannosaminuronic acid transferase (WecB/TagA/CpsF family)
MPNIDPKDMLLNITMDQTDWKSSFTNNQNSYCNKRIQVVIVLNLMVYHSEKHSTHIDQSMHQFSLEQKNAHAHINVSNTPTMYSTFTFYAKLHVSGALPDR